jgi:putative spermidine/putrescine transport system permease protein
MPRISASVLRTLALALLMLLCGLPVALSVGYAALYSLGMVGLLSNGVTLANWAELLHGPFARSIVYSSYVAAASIGLSLALAFGLLFALRPVLQRDRVYRLLFLPLTLPPMVAAFVTYQLASGSGLLSRVAWHVGLVSEPQAFPVLVNDPYALGIIITHAALVAPFLLLVLLNLWESENLSALSRVAASLGASRWQIARRVQGPVLARGLFPLTALYFVFFLGAYDIPLVLGASSPRMISVLILEKLQRYNLADIPVAYAMATWYATLCLTTIAVLYTQFSRRYQL